jgi:hypothetical protein
MAVETTARLAYARIDAAGLMRREERLGGVDGASNQFADAEFARRALPGHRNRKTLTGQPTNGAGDYLFI